jgi:hypothetical protein
MSEAREIELRPVEERVGGVEYVLVAPNDPEAMRRHTEECRERGYKFLADPSQQLAFGGGELIRDLIDGAEILFSNEYESALIEKKTGWSADEIRSRVGTWVITLGAAGVRWSARGGDIVVRQCRRSRRSATGGDAFRAASSPRSRTPRLERAASSAACSPCTWWRRSAQGTLHRLSSRWPGPMARSAECGSTWTPPLTSDVALPR